MKSYLDIVKDINCKGVIFDFDGTLFDSMSIWDTAGTRYLASIGVTAKSGLDQKLITMSMERAAEYVKEEYALLLTVEEIIDGVSKTIEDFYLHEVEPKGDIIRLLDTLKSKDIKMCIATATFKYLVEATLKRYDMAKYFEDIFTCIELGHGKEEPYIYEYACDAMKINKDEVVVVEDAYHAAKTAKDAGFYVVGVYDQYEKKTNEVKEIADIYVSI